MVDCGTDGNTVRAGSTVHAALSYTDAGESLDWLSFQGECGPDSLGFAAEPGPVVVSLQNTYAGTSTWTVNTGSAMGALVSEDGVAQVPCGTGNDIPYGGSVRVALGYAR